MKRKEKRRNKKLQQVFDKAENTEKEKEVMDRILNTRLMREEERRRKTNQQATNIQKQKKELLFAFGDGKRKRKIKRKIALTFHLQR